ncbi:MAG: hypothetical protein DHS20C18_55200 [Saprospiraceae bacterium]|nr:MAG: hypothetical protein DHS20C18_55200 [Saprospiraceae bacterium]
MNKIINQSLVLLAGLGILTTLFLIIAFPTFIEFIETYISADGKVNSPARVVYTIYIGFLALFLFIFIFKTGISHATDQPRIADLSNHVKILYSVCIIVILLRILAGQSSFLFEEDGLLENLTALLSFSAAVIFLYLALKNEKSIKRFFLLALGALLFLFAMEEISWGQRIIGWETPKALHKVNTQHETNLHNIFNQYFEVLYLIFFPIVCLFFFIRKDVVEIAKKFSNIDLLVPYIPSPEFFYAGFVFLFLFPFTLFIDKGGETLEPVFAILFFGYAYNILKTFRVRQRQNQLAE